MLNKYLIPLLTTTILSISLSPVLAQTTRTTNIAFTCEEDRGIPLTVATNEVGETQTIFSWKQKAFADYLKAQKLCHSVTEKLNNYVAQGHDLSLFILQPSQQGGLPTICATETGIDCDLVLLTLAPSEEPIDKACETLSAILSQDISEPTQEQNRSIQANVLFPISLF